MPRRMTQEKAKEQLGFLKRSVGSFLEGHSAEALRIATTIRVLVHETGRSKPLLKQISQNYLEMPIVGNAPPTPTRPGGVIIAYIGLGFQMSSDKGLQPISDLSELNLQMMPRVNGGMRAFLYFLVRTMNALFSPEKTSS